MSSSYLTSTDLRMISRLLVEDPASGTDVSRQTEARLLIYAFQDAFGEEKMRNLLADFRTVKRLLNRPTEMERLAGTVPTSGKPSPDTVRDGVRAKPPADRACEQIGREKAIASPVWLWRSTGTSDVIHSENGISWW